MMSGTQCWDQQRPQLLFEKTQDLSGHYQGEVSGAQGHLDLSTCEHQIKTLKDISRTPERLERYRGSKVPLSGRL